MTSRRVLAGSFYLTLFIFLSCVCVVIYGRFFEKPYVQYTNLPFPVLNYEVVAGQPVELLVARYNSKNEDMFYPSSHRMLCRNGDFVKLLPVDLPGMPLQTKPGQRESISRFNVVPINTQKSVCYFEGTALVSGLLYVHEVKWSSGEFMVTPFEKEKK